MEGTVGGVEDGRRAVALEGGPPGGRYKKAREERHRETTGWRSTVAVGEKKMKLLQL